MRNRALVCFAVTAIFISACNLQSTPAVAVTAPPAADVPAAAPTAGPTTTLIPLPQNPVQATITLGAAPVAPPPVLPAGPGVPGLTGLKAVSAEALNCREGPALSWPVITVLGPGQSVEVAAKNEDGSWWYVKNPSLTGGFCWVSGEYAAVAGNTDNVPKMAVSPAPLIFPTDRPEIVRVIMGVDPVVIEAPGCVGPIGTVTVWAKVQTNGELDIRANFMDEDERLLSSHHMKFAEANIKDIDHTFTPPVDEGAHTINLVVNDFIFGSAAYVIECP